MFKARLACRDKKYFVIQLRFQRSVYEGHRDAGAARARTRRSRWQLGGPLAGTVHQEDQPTDGNTSLGQTLLSDVVIVFIAILLCR